MFLRIDKLQVEMPKPSAPDPNAAAAVQELMGGRFGEMSTLMNYMYQSFNFRGRDKLRPYYALIANIATEELGHIELVAATVNSLLNAIPSEGDPATGAASFKQAFKDARISHHHIVTGHGIMAANSMGQPWRGDYIFNSGNLILDLLHNFFLENGARTQKLRVYEMTDNPSARQMLGYLFVRGGVHAHAYALALEQLTGVEMKKMLPIPNIENVQLPESRPFEEKGLHRKLYRFSPDDYKEVAAVWQGTALDGSGPLEVVDGPPQGGDHVQLDPSTDAFIPDYHPEEIQEIAMKLYQKAGGTIP
ncbi:manganese catalase family protein [Benzoatithermus flavus]|uniref:Manganese catalase family protein n=1 Tax=Benzoatithermus flavus TaxID=3108223 RepID=A0ABU8XR96_9PROT